MPDGLQPLSRLHHLGQEVVASGWEALVWLAALRASSLSESPNEPRSIFILRNNDIGDLLVITPLFEALRRRFPGAWIAVGIGDWNREVLRLNPHLSEVVPVNAPWFNKYEKEVGSLGRLAYLRRSSEVKAVADRRFEIGIDVLGSTWGSLFLLRSEIPYRLGVRGYSGGHSAVQAAVAFNPEEHVGRSALRFAEMLGMNDLPPIRPQIFLSAEEREEGERWWSISEVMGQRSKRIVIAPGGGLTSKRWPSESFAKLAAGLSDIPDLSVLVLGGPREEELVAKITAAIPTVRVFPEPPPLRQVFALVAAGDLIVSNSSMSLHVAAAFSKPTIVLLGEPFPSASQHQAQWGYPGLSRSLGKEPGIRTAIYTPAEALKILREEISRLEPRSQ